MIAPEPRFAKVAAMIADPTRARMLAALMGGQYLAAGELAAAADVTPPTASAHVAKLLDAELLVLRVQGRHRYFRLADEGIGQALEALSLVAERGTPSRKWEQGAYKALKRARSCYCHLAGELGVALLDALQARGALAAQDGHFTLTDDGRALFERAGIAVPAAAASRRYAYPCLDWSERRDHLAGALATAWFEHSLAAGWLQRIDGSRALRLSVPGRDAFERCGVTVPR